MSIIKTIRTNYYELDWTVDYGATREKIYLAIKGKIDMEHPILYLQVRNVSSLWHRTNNSNIKKISKFAFLKKATGHNIVRFYSTLPEYNKLLNYPKSLQQYFERFESNWNNQNKESSNKKSVLSEIKQIKIFAKLNNKVKSKDIERNVR